MTDPTLSSAAQAVLDAFLNGYACKPSCNVAFEADRNGIAAALRAAVKFTKKQKIIKTFGVTTAKSHSYCLEKDLLAIAAELEAHD